MEEVYVDYTNQVNIICPKCGLETNKNVFKFKDTHKGLNVNVAKFFGSPWIFESISARMSGFLVNTLSLNKNVSTS
ncbi:MAG: hypothetical protein MUO88_17360 [Desulfobacterales bacterium]|nr:hypothetical protein [Desulfobacterales bacterium]